MLAAEMSSSACLPCSGCCREHPRHAALPPSLALGQVVCAATNRLYADASYDSAENRALCRHDGIQPRIRKVGEPHESGLGPIRYVVEHDCAWLLANKRPDRRQDGQGRIISTLHAACLFIIANRISVF